MVDGARPRERVPPRLALHDGHLQARLTEEDGGQQADGAAADDHAVNRRLRRRRCVWLWSCRHAAGAAR
jgi:hypothetical protein